MNRNYYGPIRCRRDGSVYVHRDHLLKDLIAYLIFILAIALAFAAIVLFAFAAPPKTEAQSNEVAADIKEVASFESLPSIYPVEGRLTNGFGYRRDPFGRSSEFHPGQDIAAPRGTPVVAPADGQVIFAGQKRGYGNFVIIRHDDEIVTRYGHLSHFVVKKDQPVKRGDELGEVGSTGRSTGPHLHYEVLVNDQKVDPMGYLPK